LTPGIVHEITITVAPEYTARHIGSGTVAVLATPYLIALCEEAATKAVQPYLPEGQTTVGIMVNVHHLAATPVGMKVTARAELIAVEGRRLTFAVTARDEVEKVGEGTHQRVIIDVARFLDKVTSKAHRR
jgi:predicted thioesterase